MDRDMESGWAFFSEKDATGKHGIKICVEAQSDIDYPEIS